MWFTKNSDSQTQQATFATTNTLNNTGWVCDFFQVRFVFFSLQVFHVGTFLFSPNRQLKEKSKSWMTVWRLLIWATVVAFTNISQMKFKQDNTEVQNDSWGEVQRTHRYLEFGVHGFWVADRWLFVWSTFGRRVWQRRRSSFLLIQTLFLKFPLIFLFWSFFVQFRSYIVFSDHLALMMEALGDFPEQMEFEGGRFAEEFFNSCGELRHIHSLTKWYLSDVLERKYLFSKSNAESLSASCCQCSLFRLRREQVHVIVWIMTGWLPNLFLLQRSCQLLRKTAIKSKLEEINKLFVVLLLIIKCLWVMMTVK